MINSGFLHFLHQFIRRASWFLYILLLIFSFNEIAAQNILSVQPSPLTFGDVFPGENLTKDFSISLAQGVLKANYKISLTSQSNPSICDFISVINIETENDKLDNSFLVSPQDTQDLWQISLSVPIDIDLSYDYSSCGIEIFVMSWEGQPVSPIVPSISQSPSGGAVPVIFLNSSGFLNQEKTENFLPSKNPSVATNNNSAAFVWQIKSQAKTKIVYDIFSHSSVSEKLVNFGYAWGTEWGNFTKDHLKNISGLKSNTKYFYRIGAFSPSGNIFISPEWYFVTTEDLKDKITITSPEAKIIKAGAILTSDKNKITDKAKERNEKKAENQNKELLQTEGLSKSRNKNLGELFIFLGILILLFLYYLKRKERNNVHEL